MKEKNYDGLMKGVMAAGIAVVLYIPRPFIGPPQKANLETVVEFQAQNPQREEHYIIQEQPEHVPQPNLIQEPKIDYRTTDFSQDTDQILLARMIFGEARNCSDREKIAIGYTALNRATDNKKWNGTTIKSAILCPKQYSCFNSNDSNLAKLKDPEKYDARSWAKCLEVASGVLSGKYSDELHATHYHTTAVHPAWGKSNKMTELGKVDKHLFYREN